MRYFFLLWVIMFLYANCGKKSDDDSGSSGSSVVPADWDGTADYPNSRWEFVSP